MGHRSWLTPVNTKSDYKKVLQFAKNNYGVNYVIHITKEGKHPWELGDVIIAWSGDGSSSKEGLKPDSSYHGTWLLDELLDIYPNWHSGKKGPEKYGIFIKSEDSPDWSKPKIHKKYIEKNTMICHWLTRIYSKSDYKKVLQFAKNDSGVNYVIQITKEGKHPWKLGDVIIAWSGDGSSSIEVLKPYSSYHTTWRLDVLLDIYPNWHSEKKGPEKYGTFIKSEDTPDWSCLVKPKIPKKNDSSFLDIIYTVNNTMVYSCLTSWFDLADNFEFVFDDANGNLFFVLINGTSYEIFIDKLNAPNNVKWHKINELPKILKWCIPPTYKMTIKKLIQYLESEPKQSLLDYLETNQLI